MSISPLRLDADMMMAPSPTVYDTAADRVCRLTGVPTPRVVAALAQTPLRFSLVTPKMRKIRVVQ